MFETYCIFTVASNNSVMVINYYELVKSNPGYFKQFTVNDLLFLNYDCPIKTKKGQKWTAHNYIYYVLSGRKTFHTPDHTINLESGSIAFLKKGACTFEQHLEEPFCVVVFIMPDSFILSFLKDYLKGERSTEPQSRSIIPVYDDVMIKSFYTSLIPYFAAAENIPENVLELKFKELLLHILHNPANRELRNYFLSLREQNHSPLQEIMENNFAYNLGIEAYAKMTNRSVSSFKRDFQLLYKTSPGRWLMDKKLEYAKRLLLETSRPVAEVAFDSGFENTAHFSRLFKQKNNFTPLEFRKKAATNEVVAV